MTKFKKHLALSTTAMLIASLAACSKHTLRENTTLPTPSTSANPLKAEAEDAAAEEKAGQVAGVEAAADGRELTEAEKDAALFDLKKANDAKAAAKGLSVDQVADMFASDTDGVQLVDAPAAVTASVQPLQSEQPAQLNVPAKTEIPTETASVAIGAAAPVVAPESANGSKRIQIVIPVPGSRGGGPSTVVESVQTAAIAGVSANQQDSVKRAFVKAMIQPFIRLNAKVFQQRHRIQAIQKKISDKVEISSLEKEEIAKLKADYLLDSKATIEDLLARVDGVQMSFLIAPLAIKTKWNTEGEVSEALMASRIQELNVAKADDKVRFRSARVALKTSKGGVESIELMKAFLNYNAADKNMTHDLLISTVTEIAAIAQEPEIMAEIERARLAYIEEAARLAVKPKDRN